MAQRKTPPNTEKLRGAARLVTDATTGITDVVEAMHERVARLPGTPTKARPGRTQGITGLVYQGVRQGTKLVGASVDAVLALLGLALHVRAAPATAGAAPSPEQAAIVAALNGVLGDYLVRTANPLATPMAMCRDGEPISLTSAALRKHKAQGMAFGPDAVLLVHGLCMHDGQWLRKDHNHGTALARDSGLTPVYLRYNTGLPVADNGRTLAQQLELLVKHWPVPMRRLVIIGHSMGGLVARSAWHEGVRAKHAWPKVLTDLVFLGTPLQGATLERVGQGIDSLLGAWSYAAPLARLGRVRSAGINDLRDGRPAQGAGAALAWSLPQGVRCFAVAGELGAKPVRGVGQTLHKRFVGDGLVTTASALGKHRLAAKSLNIPADRQWIGQGLSHFDLLSSPEVYKKLRVWLSSPASAAGAKRGRTQSPKRGA